MAFGDRRRAKVAAHQAELDQEQAAFVTDVLGAIDGTAPLADVPVAVKPGERALLVLRGAGLFEPLAAGGRWEGQSRGLSTPVPDLPRVRFRVGQARGHYVRSPETPTVLDRGDVTITDHRVVFQGAKQGREWDFARLIGFAHDDRRGATAIQVSNRQKVSGIVYAGIDLMHVHLALEVGAAMARGHEADAVGELRALLPAQLP